MATGIPVDTPISQIDPSVSKQLGYTYRAGELVNPASKAGLGAYANLAALSAPALYQMSKTPDEPSIMDDESFTSLYPSQTYYGMFGNRMPSFAADGGIMDLEYMDKYAMGGEFPRRQGQISGPGGPKDDLVPAMLSDGEFVMTAKAVDNAGGPRAMYNLMNRLDPESSTGMGVA